MEAIHQVIGVESNGEVFPVRGVEEIQRQCQSSKKGTLDFHRRRAMDGESHEPKRDTQNKRYGN